MTAKQHLAITYLKKIKHSIGLNAVYSNNDLIKIDKKSHITTRQSITSLQRCNGESGKSDTQDHS